MRSKIRRMINFVTDRLFVPFLGMCVAASALLLILGFTFYHSMARQETLVDEMAAQKRDVLVITLEASPLGKTKIDKKGVFSAQISLPKNISPGSHRVRVATKGDEGILLSLTVVPRPTPETEVPVQTRQISNESKQSTMRTLDDASPSEGNNSVIVRSNGRAEDILTAQIPTNEMLRLDRTKSPLESAGAIVLSFASLALGMLLLRRGGSSREENY